MSFAAVLLRLGLIALILVAVPATASASSKGPGYQTAFSRWTAETNPSLGAFGSAAVLYQGDNLTLNLVAATLGTDTSGMYNSGSYKVGEAEGPVLTTAFGFTEAIASWNAETPDGTWVEIQMRARYGSRWTKWYNMGVWASSTGTITRHSVSAQGDADGYVATDTLVLSAKKSTADALQLKVRLFSAGDAVPNVSRLAVTYNNAADKKGAPSAGNPANWNTLLAVPECSQMVYPNGGNVWCSATSTSMVLGFWGIDPGPCETRVMNAVNGVYDYVYKGYGNWPFNTAYAASRGMEAYVVRFTGLDSVEPWVEAGVPVVVSYAWKKGELNGAPIDASNGHLGVIVGFDAKGNPIVNDPAAASDDAVQRTYQRSEFEPLWLGNSGGTVYLIYPKGFATPSF
jgi:hypothetical protein